MVVNECPTPTEVSHRFAEAINASDLQSALACWSPDGVIVAQGEPQIRGHDALTERFAGLIAAGAQLQISVSDEVRTEQGAMATTRMNMTVPTKGEPAAIELAGVVMYVPGPNGLQILIDRLTAQ
jgi:ketosteroid isomerase-like protein